MDGKTDAEETKFTQEELLEIQELRFQYPLSPKEIDALFERGEEDLEAYKASLRMRLKKQRENPGEPLDFKWISARLRAMGFDFFQSRGKLHLKGKPPQFLKGRISNGPKRRESAAR